MLKQLQHRLNLLLGSIPVLATLTVTASPSIAATFASSSTNLSLNNFSDVPANVGTVTDEDLSVSGNSGSITGDAEINAVFFESEPLGSDSSSAEVEGEGQEYQGTAKTEVELIGNNFLVEAGSTFSFDFVVELVLETAIDNPPGENAIAESNVSFSIFDNETNALLDSFSISAGLETDEPDDILSVQSSSSNFDLMLDVADTEFGGNEEFIEAFYIGEFSREFSEDTILRLVAVTTNHASVKAPEPSGVVAVLIFGAAGVALRKRKSL
ncbi:MAG: hypothetical protein AAFO04_03975 [Cyanobacteria bacterium J06592_8]